MTTVYDGGGFKGRVKTTKRDTSPVAVSAVRPFRPGRLQPWDPDTHTLTWHTHVLTCTCAHRVHVHVYMFTVCAYFPLI